MLENYGNCSSLSPKETFLNVLFYPQTKETKETIHYTEELESNICYFFLKTTKNDELIITMTNNCVVD